MNRTKLMEIIESLPTNHIHEMLEAHGLLEDHQDNRPSLDMPTDWCPEPHENKKKMPPYMSMGDEE